MGKVINMAGEVIYEFIEEDDTLEETFQLALESIFRWTLYRDEMNDDHIIRSIKKVASHALRDHVN